MNLERLKQLRQLMQENDIDYYFVPSADAHQNEYLPNCWERRAWITGFTGSAGDALIGLHDAFLWTDGRYFLQAEQQLDMDLFQLMKQMPGTPSIPKWLSMQEKPLRIGLDSQLITIDRLNQLEKALENTDTTLVAVENNWIDRLWADQAPLPSSPILCLDLRFTGQSLPDKLKALRQTLKKTGRGCAGTNTS